MGSEEGNTETKYTNFRQRQMCLFPLDMEGREANKNNKKDKEKPADEIAHCRYSGDYSKEC